MDRIWRPPAHRRRWSSQAGQVAPLLIGVLAVVAVALFAVARLGAAASERGRAQAAADAAALAGAAEGRAAAERLVTANGATTVAYRTVDGDVLVTVVVGHARATARARRSERQSVRSKLDPVHFPTCRATPPV